MTALKGKAIDAFLAKRDQGASAILVYGPDLGLVRERANKVAALAGVDPKDPFNYLELQDADLKGVPSRLADELCALSLMGGERVIRIRTTGEGAAEAAKIAIEGLDKGYLKPNGVLIIEGGDLAKSSGLRKAFEAAKSAVALPCYADAPADLRAIAVEAARAEDLTFDEGALSFLVSFLGEDRGLSRAEIDKLILYKGPRPVRTGPAAITLDDVRASLVDTISDAGGEAASAAADGSAPRLALALHRLQGAGSSPIGALRLAQREMTRLRAAQAMVADGASAETAMARLRPPVFFMEKRAFEARLRRWPLARIDAALEALLEAELGAKSTGLPDQEIAERALFKIALMGAR
ncbi:MAG: DNA polymerase III subunit delta [Parvularculaceae bacterium]|nr:DNA polymerase III subunit delta [Parvularculaceae bacterium]